MAGNCAGSSDYVYIGHEFQPHSAKGRR